MTRSTILRIRSLSTIQRLVALGGVLLPLVLAACGGDNSGGGAGY
jgi:hypothetical protein